MEDTHRQALLFVLSRPGYALGPRADCRSAAFTLAVHGALDGADAVAAVRVAAAVELQMEAAFIFDDVADAECDPADGLEPAEQLALAIALLTCGSSLAAEAVGRMETLGEFHRQFLAACGGQFLDARLQRARRASAGQALQMTTLKAGALGRFAAGIAARLATEERETLRAVEDLGFNLFTYAQLVDDLRDACPDLACRKKTLPSVLFGRGRIRPREFVGSEAALVGALVAEVFLNRAKDSLRDLSHRRYRVGHLGRFLESFSRIDRVVRDLVGKEAFPDAVPR